MALDAPREHDYPLPERAIDLFLHPRRLFDDLRQSPRILGASLLSTAVVLAGYSITLSLWDLDLPLWMSGASLIAGALALWGYLCMVGVSGMAWGGFADADLPFRHWLALAAHCALVSVLVVPLEVGAVLWTGDPDLQLNLAELLGQEGNGLSGAFLSRISLRSVSFLTFFSLGASVLAGAPWSKTLVFVFGSWTCIWFMLAWFTAGS